MSLIFASPAKINLFLRVLGRREDGYHELASLLQAVDWHDTLSFELADEDRLFCNDLNIPLDHTNQIFLATDLFRRKTGKSFGLRVHLEKRIPMEAGLGGGSSNAATTLWALHKLFPGSATEEDLCQWSAEIGSDQPFFFSQGTALCKGRGEVVENLSLPFSPQVWIVKPNESLPTSQVYSHVRPEDWNHHTTSVDEDLAPFQRKRLAVFNDLEASAIRIHPVLQEWKESLGQSGQRVVMTGAGSAFLVFGKPRPMVPVNIFCQQVRFLQRKPGHWYIPDISRVHALASDHGYGGRSYDV